MMDRLRRAIHHPFPVMGRRTYPFQTFGNAMDEGLSSRLSLFRIQLHLLPDQQRTYKIVHGRARLWDAGHSKPCVRLLHSVFDWRQLLMNLGRLWTSLGSRITEAVKGQSPDVKFKQMRSSKRRTS